MMNLGGTTKAKFREIQNKKNHLVQTINYMPNYSKMPLVLLRLQDYMIYHSSPNNIPMECQQTFKKYMTSSTGNPNAMGAGNNMMNKNINSVNSGGLFNQGNNNPSSGGMFQNKNSNSMMGNNIMSNLNMQGSRNITIPGSNNMNSGNGLFNSGNNNQNRATGLFNSGPSQTNMMGNPTSGLFNKGTATNPMNQSTLFSKPGMPTSTGLFSNNANQNPMMSKSQSTQNLFSNVMSAPSTNAGGLFNTGAQGNKQSSLFNSNMGNNNTQRAGFFNNTNNMNKGTGGLMGGTGLFNNQNKQPGGGTGLFSTGNNMAKPGGTGMFSNPNSMQPTSSLFSGNNLNNKPQNMNNASIFNPPNAMNQNMNQTNQMQMNPQMMMNPAMQGGYAMVCLPLNSNNPVKGNDTNSNNNDKIKDLLGNLSLLTGKSVATKEDQTLNSILDQFKKFDTNHYSKDRAYSEMSRDSNDTFYDSILSLSQYDGPFVFKNQNQSFLKAKSNAKKYLKGMKKRRKKLDWSRGSSTKPGSDWSSSMNHTLTNTRKPQEVLPTEKLVGVSNFTRKQDPVLDKISEGPVPQAKNFQLEVFMQKYGMENSWNIKLNENDYIASIFEPLVEKNLMKEKNIVQYSILHKDKQLSFNLTLSESSLQSGDRVFIYNKSNIDQYFAKMSIVPFSSRPNYIFSPDLIDLCRMTDTELKNVDCFSVENEHGRIAFMDPVDLRHANFDKIITIEHKYIEVYGDEDEVPKPKKGEGLNCPAMITFFNFTKSEKQSKAVFITKLKRYAKKMNAKLIKYDEERKEVSINVSHF